KSGPPQGPMGDSAAGRVSPLVTRPAQFGRRAELGAEPRYFAFTELDDRRDDLDLRLRLRPDVNRPLERFVVFGTAIGIARTVFGDRADVDSVGADDLGPARGDREQVRVPERDI